MFLFMIVIVMPLLVISVTLGYWAQKQQLLTAMKVWVGQLMIDSVLIAALLMYYFDQGALVMLFASVFYVGIASVRLRQFFSRLEQITKQ